MKTKLNKGEGLKFAHKISDYAREQASNCDSEIEIISFQLGWLQQEIAYLLEKGTAHTIERYSKLI
jgi:hypothetical protein